MEPYLKPNNLEDKTIQWLRSPAGLITLTSAWRTGLYFLKKERVFINDTIHTYEKLKNGGFCVGIEFVQRGYPLAYQEEPDPPERFLTQEAIEEEYRAHYKVLEEEDKIQKMTSDEKESYFQEKRNEARRYAPGFVVHFFLCFNFEESLRDHFEALTDESKQFLLACMWDEIARFEPILDDARINVFSVCGSDGEKKRSRFMWEGLEEGREGAYLFFEYKILDSDSEITRLAGNKFSSIRNIIRQYRPPVLPMSNGPVSTSKKNRLFSGSNTKLWEEKLATYLLSEGFLVSLEPDLYIPQQSSEPRRSPDLIVIHKGRVIIIEIDSAFHFNVETYRRDRILDRFMLCNGIPVLRVWYEEVRDSPEKVMTQVMEIYESLGGGRFTYR